MKKNSLKVFSLAALVAGALGFVAQAGSFDDPVGQELVDLTTATAGSVDEDSNYYQPNAYRGAMAFDGSKSGGNTRWLAYIKTDPVTSITYKFNEATAVGAYKIWNGGSGGSSQQDRSLKAWRFFGSSDNKTWTLLDQRTDISKWNSGEARYFQTTNGTAYQYYKFIIDANYNNTLIQLHEIEFYAIFDFSISNVFLSSAADGVPSVGLTVNTLDADEVWVIADDGMTEPIQKTIASTVVKNESVTLPVEGLAKDKTYGLTVSARHDTIEATVDAGSVYTGVPSIETVEDADLLGLRPAKIRVSRASDDPLPLEIRYAISSETAVPGINFKEPEGVVTIPAGESSVIVEITPLPVENQETDIDLAFGLLTGAYALGEGLAVNFRIKAAKIPEGYCVWMADAESDGRASTAANWHEGRMPTATDKVLLDGALSNVDMTWDAGVNGLPDTVAAWQQNVTYTGTVTLLTTFPNFAGSTFKTFTVSGPCEIMGGAWTHPISVNLPNSSVKYTLAQVREMYSYRLDLSVGTLVVGPDARIDAKGKGMFQSPTTNAGRAPNYGASSHGGQVSGSWFGCYGDVKRPEDIGVVGSCATDGSGAKHGTGGGAVKIHAIDSVTVNGVITVDGLRGIGNSSLAAGSAGSVLIEAKRIDGTGLICADGVNSGNKDYFNGTGGRIALLTADAVDFTALTVSAGVMPTDASNDIEKKGKRSAPGTVFVKDATMREGVLRIINRFDEVTTFALNQGVLPVAAEGRSPWTFDGIVLKGSGAQLFLPTESTISLPNGLASVRSENTATYTAGIIVRGGTLLLPDAPQTISGRWFFAPMSGYAFSSDLSLENAAVLGLPSWSGNSDTSSTLPEYVDISVSVAGDFTIASGASVTVRGGGLTKSKNTENSGFSGLFPGGTHGGRSKENDSWDGEMHRFYTAYDSVFAPHLPGVGFPHPNGQGCASSAGVITLTVNGTLRVDGAVNANGNPDSMESNSNSAGGVGGAINISAGSLEGSGKITADGGSISNWRGAGGRVAVKLTDAAADFSAFTGVLTASGRTYANTNNHNRDSSSGSVYLETAKECGKCGTLRIAMNASNGHVLNTNTTEIVSLGIAGSEVATGDQVEDYKNVKLEIDNYSWAEVNVPNLKMRELAISDTAKLDLAGHTLTVKKAFVNGTKLSTGTYTKDSADVSGYVVGDGSLVVTGGGLVLFLR